VENIEDLQVTLVELHLLIPASVNCSKAMNQFFCPLPVNIFHTSISNAKKKKRKKEKKRKKKKRRKKKRSMSQKSSDTPLLFNSQYSCQHQELSVGLHNSDKYIGNLNTIPVVL